MIAEIRPHDAPLPPEDQQLCSAAMTMPGAPIVRSFTTQLPGDPRALPLSRTWTRRMVTILGWHGDILRAVEAVSRLVDNGVKHGIPEDVPLSDRMLTLSAAIDEAGALLIDVSDLNPVFRDFEAAVRGEKGRGLWQVAFLGAQVTRFVPHEGTGKTVRAVLAPGPVDL
ncbi:ATP-binding protein [Streptomyces sp. SCSIO 30461]|uniref:ATP-binding protein n=1 Tax=Streptomyces sp. SCSIO 30461 TaxID=3118085 RepID=UPI0030D1FC27